jgi:hypothetical protein
MVQQPDVVWANAVGLTDGLFSIVPVRCFYKDGKWIDDHQDFRIKKLGVDSVGSVVVFSSTNRTEVEQWTLGVLSTIKVLTHSSLLGNGKSERNQHEDRRCSDGNLQNPGDGSTASAG